jgi:hypothetical protein
MDRKKILAVIAAISLVAGCCLMLILYPVLKGEDIFHPQPSPQQVGEAFFQALKEEDYDSAFAMCDATLRNELINPANFQYLIELYEYQPQDWEFQTRQVSANQMELSGKMDFKFHADGVFRLILRKYEDGWKISVFHLDYS